MCRFNHCTREGQYFYKKEALWLFLTKGLNNISTTGGSATVFCSDFKIVKTISHVKISSLYVSIYFGWLCTRNTRNNYCALFLMLLVNEWLGSLRSRRGCSTNGTTNIHLYLKCSTFGATLIFMRKEQDVRIRVSSLEKQGFEKAAEIAGIGLSAWARQKLRSAAIKDLQDVGEKIPFLTPIKIKN